MIEYAKQIRRALGNGKWSREMAQTLGQLLHAMEGPIPCPGTVEPGSADARFCGGCNFMLIILPVIMHL